MRILAMGFEIVAVLAAAFVMQGFRVVVVMVLVTTVRVVMMARTIPKRRRSSTTVTPATKRVKQ